MNEKLLREIRTANKEHPGSPILLFELRQRVSSLNKEEFDDSVLELAESEGYQLVRHLYPESLSKHELELMVSDGEGNFLLCDHYAAREGSVIDQEGLATNTGAHAAGTVQGCLPIG